MEALQELDAAIQRQEQKNQNVQTFDSIPDIRAYITTQHPEEEDCVDLELCVLSCTPFKSGLHLEMVSKQMGPVWELFQMKLEKLEVRSRDKYLLKLTLWVPKKQITSVLSMYKPGQVYKFRKVSDLKMYYEVAECQAQLLDQKKSARFDEGKASPVEQSTTNAHEQGKANPIHQRDEQEELPPKRARRSGH